MAPLLDQILRFAEDDAGWPQKDLALTKAGLGKGHAGRRPRWTKAALS